MDRRTLFGLIAGAVAAPFVEAKSIIITGKVRGLSLESFDELIMIHGTDMVRQWIDKRHILVSDEYMEYFRMLETRAERARPVGVINASDICDPIT